METPDISITTIELRGDFSDPVLVWHLFLELVNALSVKVLKTQHHMFPGGGLTGTVIIAESHAAIHTWPERGYAWLELVTCGDKKDLEKFKDLATKSFKEST